MSKNKFKNELLEAKRQMKICKPLQGTLGNQYYYWEQKVKELTLKSQ